MKIKLNVVAGLFVLIGLYYLVPGIHHIHTTSSSHYKYTVLFVVLAVVVVFIGKYMNPKKVG